ncbi:hypothetical protein IJH66_01945 [Candidatus Saccharibacteria bacterium]|nr:hypothetical protein [Candidatus Saccharibacteria bacterium]
MHHFKVIHSDNSVSWGLCGIPAYASPGSLGSSVAVSELTSDVDIIKKILLVSPVGPLSGTYSWPVSISTVGTNGDAYVMASALLIYKHKFVPSGSNWDDKTTYGIANKYSNYGKDKKTDFDNWITGINQVFTDDCYQKYLQAGQYTVKYVPSAKGSAQQAVVWLEGTPPVCEEEVTTSTFTPYVTVSDGTTTGNSNSHNSTSKAVTISKGNTFSDFTLTFTGSITRDNTGGYTGAATIKYGMAASSPSASTDLSSFPKNDIKDEITVKQSDISAGGNQTYCRTLKIAPSTVSSDGTTSGNKSATVCAKVTRAADTIEHAAFTGEVTATTASSSDFSEETTTSSDKKTITYYTYKASGTAKVKISGTITRGTPTDDIGGDKSSRFNFSISAKSSSPYDISSSSSTSGDLAAGEKADKNAEISATWSSLGKGEETSLGCGYLYLDTEITYTNGTEDSNGRTQGAASSNGTYCVKVKRYSNDEATFEGTTAHKKPTGKTSYVDTGGKVTKCTLSGDTYTCDGVASEDSYNFLFTNSLKRTDSNSKISSSVCKYQVENETEMDGSKDPTKCSLASNVTKTDDTLGQHEVTISVTNSDTEAGEATYCDYVSYAPKAYYYNGSFNSFATSVNSTNKCVKVTRPKNVLTQAEYTGGIKITDENGNLVDCSTTDLNTYNSKLGETINCNGPAVQSKFKLKFEYVVHRKSNDTYPNSLATKGGASLYEGTFNSSRYPSSLNKTSSALAKSGFSTIETKPAQEYTINPGEEKTICAYIKYNSVIYLRNGSERTDKSRDTDQKYKCIKITNPNPSTTVGFTGTTDSVSITDADYFTQKSNGEWYIADPNVLTSNDKYEIKFSHTIKRNDVDNYEGSAEQLYVTSSVNNSIQGEERHNNGASASSASWSNASSASWTEAFSITKNAAGKGIGQSKTKTNTIDVDLPAGTKKTYCGRINYNNTVTILYSTQKITNSTTTNSTEKCITLANPIYEYEYRNPDPRPITITPSTAIEKVTQRSSANVNSKAIGTPLTDSGSSTYLTKNTNPIYIYTQHSLVRSADGFEKVDTTGTGRIGKTTSMTGLRTVIKTFLSPNGIASGGSWTSSMLGSDGKVSNSPSSSVYSINFKSLKAGSADDNKVCSNEIASPGSYSVLYGVRWRRETYTDRTPTTAWERYDDDSNPVRVPATTTKVVRPLNGTDAQKYANPDSPKAGSDTTGDTVCASISTPYNYEIGTITPTKDGQIIENPGSNISISFNIPVNKNSSSDHQQYSHYITDLESPSIKIISFAVSKNVNLSNAGLINGGVRSEPGGTKNAFCGLYTIKNNDKNKYCNVTDGNTTNLKKGGTSTTYTPNRNLYISGDSEYPSYNLSFSSGSIASPSDLDTGDKFCIAIAFNKAADNNSSWMVSKAYCGTSAKKPTMQVWGGSVLATGGINTSYTKEVSSGKYFGSWGDFSLISGGEIKKMASGAAFSGGRALSSETAVCDYSPLTIANENCSEDNGSTLGQATLVRDDSKFYTRIKNNLIPAKAENTYYTKGYGFESFSFLSESFGAAYPAGSKIELYYKPSSVLGSDTLQVPTSTRLGSGGSQPNITNSWNNAAIFYSPGNMEVTRNMVTTANNISALSDISTFILIADGDIIIDQDVTRLDAWIIAQGTLNTCSINGVAQTPGSSDFNSDTCSQPLEINGPVYADNIVLSRTSGADYSSLSSPAERIDYNSSFLLWSYFQSSRGKFPQTVYLKELSPRY